MAIWGGIPSPYVAITKNLFSHKLTLFFLLTLLILCSLSYLLGSYRRPSAPSSLFPNLSSTSCYTPNTSLSPSFLPRHSAAAIISIRAAESKPHFPPCDSKLSEYTPCHEPKRALRFPRHRLIYRERHRPTEEREILRCRIPPPHGYKKPFRWPESRDMVWFANVPHKWLTVEKAGQNWVRFEGDRFTFPGGGTMFPRGANVYIDDIGKVINLSDGPVRTAIDTGCGVASWGAYLLSRNILTMSFAPKDSHEAQIQFALERGVPAMIGIMAASRLPYPARSFDMAHCSRCLIP